MQEGTELLAYIVEVIQSVCEAAEALYGGHQIGFPDVKRRIAPALRKPEYFSAIEERVTDAQILEELQEIYSAGNLLLVVDEKLGLWLAHHLGVPDLSASRSRARLARLVDRLSAEAAHRSEFPPSWTRMLGYQELLARSAEAIEKMRASRRRAEDRLRLLLE